MTEDTLFRVASITKLFTAQAIVQLIENGKLRLDDKVSIYLEQFKGSNLALIDLITHTSGLSDSVAPLEIEKQRSFEEYLSASLLAGDFAKTAINAEVIPDKNIFKYAGLNFNILGKIVEIVSGVAYYDYIQHNILDRLELEDSEFSRAPDVFKTLVTGHYNYGFTLTSPVRPYDTSYAPSEGLITSAK